jgi:hypothetical protein
VRTWDNGGSRFWRRLMAFGSFVADSLRDRIGVIITPPFRSRR